MSHSQTVLADTPINTFILDQSPAAVLHRIQLHLSDDADFLLQGRVRIIKSAL